MSCVPSIKINVQNVKIIGDCIVEDVLLAKLKIVNNVPPITLIVQNVNSNTFWILQIINVFNVLRIVSCVKI